MLVFHGGGSEWVFWHVVLCAVWERETAVGPVYASVPEGQSQEQPPTGSCLGWATWSSPHRRLPCALRKPQPQNTLHKASPCQKYLELQWSGRDYKWSKKGGRGSRKKQQHLYCWGQLLAWAVVAAPVLAMMHRKLPLSDLQKQPASGFLHLLLITGTRLFHFLWVSPKLLNVQLHLFFWSVEKHCCLLGRAERGSHHPHHLKSREVPFHSHGSFLLSHRKHYIMIILRPSTDAGWNQELLKLKLCTLT